MADIITYHNQGWIWDFDKGGLDGTCNGAGSDR